MPAKTPEITTLNIGVFQARENPKTRAEEQGRWRRGLATTSRLLPGIQINTVFIDAMDSKGVRQGKSLGKFVDQFHGFGYAGTSDLDEFYRDTTTKEGRNRQRYHEEVDPIALKAMERNMGQYGACFGAHELIVVKFGPKAVGNVAEYEEFGTVAYQLTSEGQKDPLFADMPRAFGMFAGHKGSVIPQEIPEDGITLLAWTKRTPISAYRINGTNSYGVQGHAKADRAYVRQVDKDFEMLGTSGLKPYTRTGELTPPYRSVGNILGNFGRIVYDAAMSG